MRSSQFYLLRSKRICYSCDSDKTTIKNGRFVQWYKNSGTDLWLCQNCYRWLKYAGANNIKTNRLKVKQTISLLSDAQLGWLAGIIDGEGHIGLLKHTKKDGRKYYAPTIRVVMTHQVTIEHIVKITACGYITHRYRSEENENWREQYTWHATNTQVMELAPRLVSFLITKKEQAKCIIEYFKHFKSHMGGGEHNTIPEWEQRERDYYYDELRRLNKKGNL